MSRFTLTLLDDGRGVLSTERLLSERQADQIKQAFESWRTTDQGILVIAECDVRHSVEIDLDVPA